MNDHRAKALIAQWFFRRLWTVVNRSEQVLAPRAGFEPATNRLTGGVRAILPVSTPKPYSLIYPTISRL